MSELVYYDLKDSTKMSPCLPVQVACELGRRIVSGLIEPGTLIDDENTLTDRYKVSRVVVRDAVKILVGKGLLDVRRGIGTRVKPREQWILWDDDVLAWHISATPNKELLAQLMDIRLALEPKAARWAAERSSPEDLALIEAACTCMEMEKGSIEKFVVADAKFHRSVLRAARNNYLNAIEGVIYSALLISVQMINKDPRENSNSIPFHRAVFEAIAAKDGDKAEQLTEQLLADAIRRLKESFGESLW